MVSQEDCSGLTMVLLSHDTGSTLVLRRYCTGTALVFRWCDIRSVLVPSWYCECSTLALHWCFAGVILELHGFFISTVMPWAPVLYWYHAPVQPQYGTHTGPWRAGRREEDRASARVEVGGPRPAEAKPIRRAGRWRAGRREEGCDSAHAEVGGPLPAEAQILPQARRLHAWRREEGRASALPRWEHICPPCIEAASSAGRGFPRFRASAGDD